MAFTNIPIEWPADLPTPPPPPPNHSPELETSCSPPTPSSQETIDPNAWIKLRQEQDERIKELRSQVMEVKHAHIYNHLPHSDIDWYLEGEPYLCRVIGLQCYGKNLITRTALLKHLKISRHIEFDALQAGGVLVQD